MQNRDEQKPNSSQFVPGLSLGALIGVVGAVVIDNHMEHRARNTRPSGVGAPSGIPKDGPKPGPGPLVPKPGAGPK